MGHKEAKLETRNSKPSMDWAGRNQTPNVPKARSRCRKPRRTRPPRPAAARCCARAPGRIPGTSLRRCPLQACVNIGGVYKGDERRWKGTRVAERVLSGRFYTDRGSSQFDSIDFYSAPFLLGMVTVHSRFVASAEKALECVRDPYLLATLPTPSHSPDWGWVGDRKGHVRSISKSIGLRPIEFDGSRCVCGTGARRVDRI